MKETEHHQMAWDAAAVARQWAVESEPVIAGLGAVFRATQPVFAAACRAMVGLSNGLEPAGAVVVRDETPTRDERWQRALEARQYRNTGPQQRTRAPRRIDPKGTR